MADDPLKTILVAPPKPPNEMTDEELDEWADQLFELLAESRNDDSAASG